MITLSSDFGSPYPAAMKGVLVSRSDARLVDVAHDFPRQDVRVAAFWLREVLPYFPPAVHLVVVDPGVGTDRAALVIRAGESALVGPDNGVLLPAAGRLAEGSAGAVSVGTSGGESSAIEVFEWRVDDPISHTFHGRDVFAPAAAAVYEAGVEATDRLDRAVPTKAYKGLRFPVPEVGDDGAIGEVLVIDRFGNVITNLPGDVLEGQYGTAIEVNSERVPVAHTYAAVTGGERVVTVGSHGNVELAVNRGRGEAAFDFETGDRVRLAW